MNKMLFISASISKNINTIYLRRYLTLKPLCLIYRKSCMESISRVIGPSSLRAYTPVQV